MNLIKDVFISNRLYLIAFISSIFCYQCLCEDLSERYRSKIGQRSTVTKPRQGELPKRFLQNITPSDRQTRRSRKKERIHSGFHGNTKGSRRSFHSRRVGKDHVAGKDQMETGLLQIPMVHKSHDVNSVKRQHLEDDHLHGHLDERPILGRCDINEQCKADQYCEGTFCFKCRKDQEHCYANGQCCKGAECQYGYCAKGVSAGMPGTYCDKAKDCKGDACCILEMSVDHHNAICKPMLEEHETCGPINLFHQITEYRAHNEPICGPCKQGLACKSIGIHGHHSVCLPEGAD